MARILVLDDVEDAARMVQRILERKGHAVSPFSDEEKALEFARAEQPELAILDIKLKRMSGIDVLAELKKHSPATRVIMLTGYPTLETARQARQLGAEDYCVKPIDKDELEDKVAQVLEGGAG